MSYGASVNIGEYESIRFDVTAEVGPQERWQDVFNRLRELVLKHKGTVKKDGY